MPTPAKKWITERRHHGGAPCAVQKVGCFPPPVATPPKVLNFAPFTPPCWYARDFFLVWCLPRVPGCRKKGVQYAP